MRIFLVASLFLIAASPAVVSCDDRDAAVREAIGASVRQRLGADAEVIVERVRIFSHLTDACASACVATPDPAARLGRTIRFGLQTTARDANTPRLVRVGSAEASIRVTVPGVRARTVIHRGDVVSSRDVESAPIELSDTPLRRTPVEAEVVGARALRDIAAGETVTAATVIVIPAVRTGQQVTGVSHFGGVEVSATLRAVESGVTGDIIRLVNPASRHDLRARILSSTKVEVIHE